MADDHPLSVAAARTLALQNADVVFLMGARFNWIFHPRFRGGRFGPGAALREGHDGHPARHRARGDRPQQRDRGGLGRPTGRAEGPPEDRLWQGDPRLRGDRAIACSLDFKLSTSDRRSGCRTVRGSLQRSDATVARHSGSAYYGESLLSRAAAGVQEQSLRPHPTEIAAFAGMTKNLRPR
jgi:hypothetical protein